MDTSTPSYSLTATLAVIAILAVTVVIVVAIEMLVHIKTLSIHRRALIRLLAWMIIMAGLFASAYAGLEGHRSSDELTHLASVFTFLTIVLVVPIQVAGWLFEITLVRLIIGLTERRSRGRREGDLKKTYRYHRVLTFLKRFVRGSIKELDDAGITI